jgi:dihydroorotate dehydrogenase (fumarate)
MTLDLSTRYLGLELEHPIVASPSPLARELDGIRRLEDAGAAAIVLPSIYEEEVEAEDARRLALREQGSGVQPEAAGYFPALHADVSSLDARLETLRRAREACSIPIIASLNGVAPTGWVHIAQLVEQAGAAAIELNLYDVPANLDHSGAVVEARWRATVEVVRAAVRVPLAVKLSPWLSAPGHFCRSLVEAGVNGLVLFNRFYQPDIDLDTLRTTSNLQLSSPHEMRQVLLWIAMLAGHVEASLAATTGVETGEHVIKYLLSGADVVMTTSALLRHGPSHLGVLRRGLEHWMEGRGFSSVQALRGRLSAAGVPDRQPLLRAQYLEMLQGYSTQRRS